MSKHIDLPISELADGAVQEKLNYELQKVFDNIHDPNTKAKDKRSVTIKLEFQPDEKRQTINVESTFTTKLANVQGVATTVLTGKDLSTGKVEARELKSSIPGQTFFDQDSQIKTDIGERVDVVEKEMQRKNIIDLQRGASK
ncbi:replication terminator protein [Ornithinibacillus sp. 4-3]|uniref:Replication terminator protein n=1 Tax=Ornithinibacillus sp. 4-3 TaxID=3231488 RepID=A0AB39HN37_9BACI